jgi:N-acetylglucosamine-6-phosphate deacetylase
MPSPGSSSGPSGPLKTPGLVDQHCHGFAGVDFATAPVAEVRAAVHELSRRGVTRVVASVPTLPGDEMVAAVRRLTGLVRDGALAGIHLEGPFLAAARCGAQSAGDLREPGTTAARDLVERLVSAGSIGTDSPNAIVAMTYAPELAGAVWLERVLLAAGILPSPGHTDATAAQFAAAIDRWGHATADHRGPRPAVTHLFNAMPGFHHRDPGPVPTALRAAARGLLRLELVADGHHVDPEVVVDVLRMAPRAVSVVSDASAATGAAPGPYRLGAVPIEAVPGHAPTVHGSAGTLASGAVGLDGALRNLLAWGAPVDVAVRSVTATPAEGLPRWCRESGWVEWDPDGRPTVVPPSGPIPRR